MRTAVSCLFVAGLTVALGAQSAGPPPRVGVTRDDRVPDGTLKARQLTVGTKVLTGPEQLGVHSHVVAKDVQIRIGATQLTADEVAITRGSRGEPDVYELRGRVRLTGKLTIE